jgi:glycosyltransferase involved in cell wall biosynthesis
MEQSPPAEDLAWTAERLSLLQRLPLYESTMATSFRLSVLVPVYNERHVVEASLRRVLNLRHELISHLQLIVVDDCSADGSREILKRLADEDDRITLLFHETNQGKGAAIRTALSHTTGDIVIVHDADLEYNPEDIPSLLIPFAKEGADAVFGSRYLSAPYRRALMFRHTLINRILTNIGNWFTDLTLTDIATCYKAVNAVLLKSIPLRSNDFRFDVEMPLKLAKRRARIFEVPIRYLPRTVQEGKKIRALDGLLCLMAMVRFSVVEDLYEDNQYGARARRFNIWTADTVRQYVGDRVLEIGAGIGNLTNQFIPRELYVASDVDANYLHYLRSYSIGKPYLRVMKIDAGNREHFSELQSQFDTVLMLNVLEHLADEQEALRNIWSALKPGGRAVILVPNHPSLYGTLDEVIGHRKRYSVDKLREALVAAGFRVEKIFDFNRISVPGWWFNGKILRRKRVSRVQLKFMELTMPLLKRIDPLWPWSGNSLIALGVK